MAHEITASEMSSPVETHPLAHHARADLAPYGPLALRLGLGAVFLAHAGAKALVFTFPGTAAYFEANGFPGWTAYPVFAAELLGGVALLLGFRTRAVALALVPVLVGALRPHLANGWMFTATGGGWEYVAFLLVALVALALAGPGAHALDGRTLHGRHASEPT
jgi:putative oxidoreductase